MQKTLMMFHFCQWHFWNWINALGEDREVVHFWKFNICSNSHLEGKVNGMENLAWKMSSKRVLQQWFSLWYSMVPNNHTSAISDFWKKKFVQNPCPEMLFCQWKLCSLIIFISDFSSFKAPGIWCLWFWWFLILFMNQN